MTKRKVMIRIHTSRRELHSSLFDDVEEAEDDEEEPCDDDPEEEELFVEGLLTTTPKRVELIYEESEASGMKGSVTTIGFDRAEPGNVTMMRTGVVRTALDFEQNRRHLCLYRTPFSDFEVCVHTLLVDNRLLSDGELNLSYRVEIHGAQAEQCKMTVIIKNREE